MTGPESSGRVPAPARRPGTSPPAVHGIGLVLFAGLCFVCMQAAAKAGTAAGYSPIQVAWARFTLHLLGVVALMPGVLALTVRTGRTGMQLLRSGLLVLSTVCAFAALERLPLAQTSIITFVTPLFVMAFAVLLLRERVGWRRWAAAAAGFAGVLVVVRPDGLVFSAGAALAVAMALFYALYQVATRALAQTAPPFVGLFYAAFLGAVACSLAVPFSWRTPDAAGWALLALPALFGGLGHYLLIRAYEHAPATLLAPFMYCELVWSLSLGFLVFDHWPEPRTFLGALIIVASGLYVWHRERSVGGVRG